MARYIEALFRYWIRFAVILILLPAPVSLATLVYYRTVQATANVWVADPTYLTAGTSSNYVAGWNQYLTPAQNETDQLDQYLQTDSFLKSVDGELANAGFENATERSQLIATIPKNMHVIANGSHLVTITFSCDKAAYCSAVLSSTIVVFQNRLTEALKAEEQLSTTFLKGQVDAADQRAKNSAAALEQYVAEHPGAAALVAAGGQSTGIPELDRLVTQAVQDRNQDLNLQTQLGQAQYTYAAADQFIQTSTRVVDAPQITKGGLLGDGSSLKKAAVVWLAAFGIAAIYLVLLVWTDKTARDIKELTGRLSVPVLATIPRLASKEMF